jgi:glycosyltransferase involved in cell wall biosynthesis
MRCLIVVPSLRRAGAETQAIDLANGLSSSGHTVHLCSFESQLDQRERLASAVEFHHVRRRNKYDVTLIGALARIMDRQQIEVVQGVMQFAALIAWLAATRTKCKPPVVAAVHTTTNRGIKEELQDRVLYRWMLRRLPAVVFVCNYQRDHWIRKYPELSRLAQVVHNGIDVSRYRRLDFTEAARGLRADLGISESSFVFACIAAFRPEKNHRLLIKSFLHLPGNPYLLLAGDGEERPAIEFAVRTAGAIDRVRFLGSVPDIRSVIVASDATVLASSSVETFSMAMLESMALEVPMIATNIGGLGEAIIHGETGLLCPPGDEESLTLQLRFLLEHRAEGRRLGRAAAERVARCFTLEKMVTGTEAVFAKVVAATSRVAAPQV